ncbi:unnamed protein product [Adineta steineri]|uniref:Uncharacterized protein n=1 Tax=Adineta steineri TaxID=433720 RepID=A0A820AHG5_9BILA|nr:unnamed protein product [Adineta steineri]
MCRDWHFNGDEKTWNWILNWKNWNVNDWARWRGHEHKYHDGHDHIHRNKRDDRECYDCRDARECHECRDCPDCGAYKLFTKRNGATCIGFRRHSGLGIGVPGTVLYNYGDDDIALVSTGGDVVGRASYVGGGHLCHCEIH